MKKICIAIISIALIIAFGISLNNVEKTELQSTDGVLPIPKGLMYI